MNEMCSMCSKLQIAIPHTNEFIRPGYRIRIGRFSNVQWLVLHDWYTWGGNRPVCGWYLVNVQDPNQIKPLQLTDLDDCYLVER